MNAVVALKFNRCHWCCRHVCPYHASRDVLQEGAALIFVTYSQLLDPPVRSANGLDDLLKGAVVVFDEVMVTAPKLLTLEFHSLWGWEAFG